MKSNVLILHTDQARYDSIGANGNPYARTPNIDRLAADGLLFSRHYAPSPVCSPSRASLLTGMYPLGHGLAANGTAMWNLRQDGLGEKNRQEALRYLGRTLPEYVPTLADMLAANGYQAAAFGKLHLEPHMADRSFGFAESNERWEEEETEAWEGPHYGFQRVRMIGAHGELPCYRPYGGHYVRWLEKYYPEEVRKVHAGRFKSHASSTRGDIYLSPLPAELHNSMWLAGEVCAYVDEWLRGGGPATGRPFFAFVGFPDPHHPFTPPFDVGREFLDAPVLPPAPKDERITHKPRSAQRFLQQHAVSDEDARLAARYTYASMALIDRAVGKIIQHLKDNGLYEHTIVLFTSDHGDMLGDFGGLYKSYNCFSALVHVPFILKPAAALAAAARQPGRSERPMSNADVVPTLLAMLGLDVPEHVQGVNIFDAPAEHCAFVSCHDPDFRTNNASLVDGRYRYTLYPHTGEEELYDLLADSQELNNLAFEPTASAAAICREMRVRLLEAYIRYDTRLFGRYSLW